MIVRQLRSDAISGVKEFVEVDLDVMTQAEAVERDRAAAIAEENARIKSEMDAADLKIVRAILDGDTARIEEHKAKQAELRAQLQ